MKNDIKHFDSFSFYGSKTSLNSQSSTHVQSNNNNNNKYYSNTSLDKYDTNSLLTKPNSNIIIINSNNVNDDNCMISNYIPDIQINQIDSSNTNTDTNDNQIASSLFYPYLIQYTDNRGQLYESQTYMPNDSNESSQQIQNIQFNNNNNQLIESNSPHLHLHDINSLHNHQFMKHSNCLNNDDMIIDEQMES